MASTRISTPPETLFLDTWGWLVLADAKDPAHTRASAERRARGARGSLVTTDYVLDETVTLLFKRAAFTLAQRFVTAIFDAESAGLLRLERITAQRFEEAYRLRLRYRDKPGISFTDLTSMVVMQELRIAHILTADAHFAQVRLGFRCLP